MMHTATAAHLASMTEKHLANKQTDRKRRATRQVALLSQEGRSEPSSRVRRASPIGRRYGRQRCDVIPRFLNKLLDNRSKEHGHEHQSRRKSSNTLHQNTHRAFHSHKDAMHAQGGVLVIDDPRIYSHITSMATWKCFGVCPHSSPFPSTTEILNHMVASHQQNSEITFDEVIANELFALGFFSG